MYFAVLLSLFSYTLAKSKLLIVHDGLDSFNNLVDVVDYDIDVSHVRDTQLISTYDNILLLSNTLANIPPFELVDHLEDGGNLLVASDSVDDNQLSILAKQFSIGIDKTPVTTFDGDKTLSINTPECGSKPVLLSSNSHSFTSKNPLSWTLLQSPPGTLNRNIISALQTTKNSRIVWSSSLDLFSNDYINDEDVCNCQFVKNLVDWTFNKLNNVQVTDITHYRTGENETAEYYYNDEANFEVALSVDDKPFITDDLQLEFTMLDPYIRATLKPSYTTKDGRSMVYKYTFRVPDKHGIFKFVIDYKRKGFSYIHKEMRTTVAPIQHDRHPRFLSHAWPYYTGVFSTIAGFLIFSVLWLNLNDKNDKKSNKKE
ncbi:Dolichyl-diphosphooligosaccharide-protein glycosyltransferase 48kDa subunit [Wallemia mellicola]|nr:Dolichyl-diphosphooligosaccharide-protein glycosyltransferase 48kDa subunit [Wallemia mellicola]